MATNDWTLEAIVARMKGEIKDDMASGLIPRRTRSFSKLHDYVDANEYGGLCADDCPLDAGSDADCDLINAAQAEIDLWLRKGAK